MSSRYRKHNAPPRSIEKPWWPGMGESTTGTPWGRVTDSFDEIMEHAAARSDASILLAAGTATGFVNMHEACEHFLPQTGAKRVAGVWVFPNKARLRVARVADMSDLSKISSRQYSLVAAVAESEVIKLIEPLLTADGRIIPFLGRR
jgi:hypothetical protein